MYVREDEVYSFGSKDEMEHDSGSGDICEDSGVRRSIIEAEVASSGLRRMLEEGAFAYFCLDRFCKS